MSVFLIDANVFITPHRSYYPFDLCPGYWSALEKAHDAKRLFTTHRVQREVAKGGDALSTWAESLPDSFFMDDAAPAVQTAFRPMMQWVQAGGFSPEEKAKFAGGADGWLVATAKHAGLCVVTQEVLAPSNTTKVKIPNVCGAFGVTYCDVFVMLRKLGCSFR